MMSSDEGQPMSVFENCVVIVTGASEGIGRALCVALAAKRARLVLAARNQERLLSLGGECAAAGTETLVHRTDVTSAESCRSLIEATVSRFGAVDVLVNNAGGTMWTPFEQVEDLTIFDGLMQLNYLG